MKAKERRLLEKGYAVLSSLVSLTSGGGEAYLIARSVAKALRRVANIDTPKKRVLRILSRAILTVGQPQAFDQWIGKFDIRMNWGEVIEKGRAMMRSVRNVTETVDEGYIVSEIVASLFETFGYKLNDEGKRFVSVASDFVWPAEITGQIPSERARKEENIMYG